MGVSIIDGRVDAAEIKRENKSFRQFSTLRFVGADGREQTIKNAVAAIPVAEQLRPGSEGRFYLFNSIDMRGVYAVRGASGAVTRQFPGQNEKIGLFGIVLALVVLVLYSMFGDGAPVIVIIALLLGIIGFFFARKARVESERAFAADNPALTTAQS